MKNVLIASVTFLFAGIAFAQDGHAAGGDPYASSLPASASASRPSVALFGQALLLPLPSKASPQPSASGKIFVPIIGLALIESLVLYAS